MDATDSGAAHSGFTQKLKDAKRRFVQVGLQKVGRAEASEDYEYFEKKKVALDMQVGVKAFLRHASVFLDGLRSLCLASSEVGVAVAAVFGTDPSAPTSAAVSTYVATASGLDSDLRRALDARMVERVIDPLKAKLSEFDDLKHVMSEREKVKIDFDAYSREVKALKEKGAAGDPHKLMSKEAKLDRTRTVLEEATRRVFDEVQWLEDRRTTLILAETREFLAIQQEVFRDGAAAFGAVPSFPDVPLPRRRRAVDIPTYSVARHSSVVPSPPPGERGSRRATVAVVGGRAAGLGEHPTAGGGPSRDAESAADGYIDVPLPPRALPPPPPPPADGPNAPPVDLLPVARVLYDYVPESLDELTLHAGGAVRVVEQAPDGWWKGRTVDGSTGLFPANYVHLG